MVIAFFPGAGGNRYLQMLLGNDWQHLGISYDFKNHDQHFDYRYLLDNVSESDSKYTLTHCMNSNKIADLFPSREITFIVSDLKQSLKREWMLNGHDRFLKKQIKTTPSRLEHYRAYKDDAWPDVDSEYQLDNLAEYILKEVNQDFKHLISDNFPVPGTMAQITQECIAEINSAYEIITWHQRYYQTVGLDYSAATNVVDISTDCDEFSTLMRTELELYQNNIFDRVWNKINE
jgi:hypothetical protein